MTRMAHNPSMDAAAAADEARAADGMALAVNRWTGQLTRRLFLRQWLLYATGYLFLWGTVVLVLRVAMDLPRGMLLYGAAGLVLLMAAAWGWAYRRRPGAAMVRAMLDSHSRAGGLYMVDARQAGWGEKLPPVKLPRVSLKFRRQGVLLAMAVFFVVMAFAVPAWVTQVGRGRPLDISSQVATLDGQLEVLKQEEVLHEEQATELSEKLHQIQREATGSDPVKTWEALDHLQSQVQDAAAEAAERAGVQSQQLDKAQMLTEALAQHGDMLSPQQLSQAMQALQDMASKAAAENERFREAMKQMGLDPASLAGQRPLTPEELQALQQAMTMTREELRQLLENLQKAGLGESAMQSQGIPSGSAGASGGRLSPEQVAQRLAQMMQGRSVEEILEAINQLQQLQQLGGMSGASGVSGEAGGSGGIGRGGGPTDMTWKDHPTSEQDAAFKDQVLPPAELQALQDSQRVGLGAGAPQVDEQAAGSSGGVLRDQDAQGSAARQAILPRHRAAVRDYFQRQNQPGAGESSPSSSE